MATATTTHAKLTCPRCGGVCRTHTTRHPAPGVTVRYRRCSTCGSNSATEVRRVVTADGVTQTEKVRAARRAAD